MSSGSNIITEIAPDSAANVETLLIRDKTGGQHGTEDSVVEKTPKGHVVGVTAGGSRVKVFRTLADYGKYAVPGRETLGRNNSQKNKGPEDAAKVSLFVSNGVLGLG